MNVLFVCSMARLRSKTAAHCLQAVARPCDYGGLDSQADKPVTKEMVDWAAIVVCMETSHKTKLVKRFRGSRIKVQVWGVPDDYDYMDDALVSLLNTKAETLL